MQRSKKADFIRRLKFYIFGLLIGVLLVNVITKGKACQMPSTVKLEELYSQWMRYDETARCQMNCRGISEKEVRGILEKGSVNYSESNVHEKPFGRYAVDVEAKGKELRFIIEDRDTLSMVMKVLIVEGKDTCICK